MSKKVFTEKEIKLLSSNQYVKSVSSKSITYTDKFKRICIEEKEKGKFPRQIFEECGFDVEILGMDRIKAASKRWKKAYNENGISGLRDTRFGNSKRSRERELTLEEKNARLEAQINLLKAENELFKKDSFDRKGAKKVVLLSSQKYILICSVIETYQLKHMVKYLCGIAGVSRSGYYNYFSVKSQERRHQKDEKDEVVKGLILKAFHFKGRKKGARQIKMTLAGQFQVVYNLKRIRRIMKKYDIICPIRKANPYRRIRKATKEHRVVPNLLNRQFKQGIPGKVLLTDITYLFYGKGQKAYLSVIKDGSTDEILAHHISERMTVKLATDTLLKLKRNKNFQKAKDALIHSDQGIQYTHPNFQKAVKKLGLQQSMSRRGNCWDNAPQESFFGHLKDEASIQACTTLDELKKEIKQYMIYYNYYRYQWNLKKMTPVQYRDHLLQAA
ncbi:IS3 family transposase [Bacillus sp. DX1.1]|uniref:IS3 family transposase n=1 Tax=unclassified Bacillus (in: firmicutes) TaxID=185979 RepID=UPI002570D6DB|nr:MULTISPECIES: IS3 family transposase [unclassified Bacillus (in: firmicutes)]MDM5157296.1 IS3 family transposase [Bacillus sp. DX1.1]WJE81523.1 IS3 family transposase [Bacillus sp. DX3.1]